MREQPRPSHRGASTTVGYVLSLAIGALVFTSVTVGVGGVLETQADRAAQADLVIAGEQTAAALERVDRLARTAEADRAAALDTPGGSVAAAIEVSLTRRVAADSYTIEITGDAVIVRTTRSRTVHRVPYRSRVPVIPTTVRGGPIRVQYRAADADPTAGIIEVRKR